jgi:protocatechuate 3,4-dioxygenase, alpha subunit
LSPTPSQTVGPFFGFGLPFEGDWDAAPAGDPAAVRIEGQVLDGVGEPVPDALIEVWGGDQFGRCRTDHEGAFHFNVRKPASRSEADGSVHAPHLEVTIFSRGLLRHLLSRLYFPDEVAANLADPVLRQVDPDRRATLIARQGDGALQFDIRLQGEGETVFFAI